MMIATQTDRVRYLKHKLAVWLAAYLSRNWDTKHEVETGGRVPLSLLKVEVVGNHVHGGYDVVSTPPSVFSYMANFFPTPRTNFTYVDIGAGKGRTVLLASEMGFKHCIGVEFASFASEIAQKNLQSYVGTSVTKSPCSIVKTCATQFPFPDGNVVLFLNNPFSESIWDEMVPRMRDITNTKRAITVILIGSFPETIRAAANKLVQSGSFVCREAGITPRFWDSYARFHFFVLDSYQDATGV